MKMARKKGETPLASLAKVSTVKGENELWAGKFGCRRMKAEGDKKFGSAVTGRPITTNL
jgi:hypothetical protein